MSIYDVDITKLRLEIEYDQHTGVFTRKKDIGNGRYAGEILGSVDSYGYLVTQLQNQNCRLHRLAFLLMEEEVPDCVDHIDGNKLNLKWSNLRKATYTGNNHNRKLSKKTSTGVKGISWVDNPKNVGYTAAIMCNGKRHIKWFALNKFPTKEAALEAAIVWIRPLREQLHGEFTNHG